MAKGPAISVALTDLQDDLQEILAVALEHSPHPVMLEQFGRVVYANRPFATMMRYSSGSDVVGRRVCDLKCDRNCESGVPAYRSDTGKYYQHRRFEVKSGRRTLKVHLAFDISERRSLEKELSDNRKAQSFGLLVSGIAHDFNNVLTAITLKAGLLSAKLEKDSWAWRQATSISGAAEQGTSLVGQLLSYLREQSPDAEEVNVDHVLRRMQPVLAPLLGEQIDFSMSLHCGNSTVLMVPSQLQQIAMNLVVNARDALDGSGKIVLESGDCLLREENRYQLPSGKYIQISVVDNGRGMDEVTRARVFEPFYSTKKSKNGTGLGLFTVQSIAKKANGAVSIESELGKGTRVEVLVPKAPRVRM